MERPDEGFSRQVSAGRYLTNLTGPSIIRSFRDGRSVPAGPVGDIAMTSSAKKAVEAVGERRVVAMVREGRMFWRARTACVEIRPSIALQTCSCHS